VYAANVRPPIQRWTESLDPQYRPPASIARRHTIASAVNDLLALTVGEMHREVEIFRARTIGLPRYRDTVTLRGLPLVSHDSRAVGEDRLNPALYVREIELVEVGSSACPDSIASRRRLHVKRLRRTIAGQVQRRCCRVNLYCIVQESHQWHIIQQEVPDRRLIVEADVTDHRDWRGRSADAAPGSRYGRASGRSAACRSSSAH